VFVQYFEEMIPGVRCAVFWPAVDEHGPLANCGNLELADKPFALNRMGGPFVIIVEADFAASDHFWLCEKVVELGLSRFISFGSIVWVDPRTRVKAGHSGLTIELATEIEGLVHLGGAFANTDGQHCADARFGRTAEHGIAVISVARAVEMRMRVDQQAGTSDESKAVVRRASAQILQCNFLLQSRSERHVFEEAR
jgi:hypothetical protein